MLPKNPFKRKAVIEEDNTIPLHLRIGKAGEDAACRHLKRQHLRIVARNFHARGCEIDIIAENRDSIIFAEVKTRTADKGSPFGRPSDAVNKTKRENIIRAAKEFVRIYCKNGSKAIRFDVIEVYMSKTGEINEIIHIKDAFGAY